MFFCCNYNFGKSKIFYYLGIGNVGKLLMVGIIWEFLVEIEVKKENEKKKCLRLYG